MTFVSVTQYKLIHICDVGAQLIRKYSSAEKGRSHMKSKMRNPENEWLIDHGNQSDDGYMKVIKTVPMLK